MNLKLNLTPCAVINSNCIIPLTAKWKNTKQTIQNFYGGLAKELLDMSKKDP